MTDTPTADEIAQRYRVLSITTEAGSTYEHRFALLARIPDGSHWAISPQSIKWPMTPNCEWKADDVIQVGAALLRGEGGE